MARWVFATPFGDSYTLGVNPNTGGSPQYLKQFEIVPTTSAATQPTGSAGLIMFEGRPQAPVGSISGTSLSQSQINSMLDFFQFRSEVIITDDLARTFTVAVTGFNVKRTPTRAHPFRCVWTMNYLLLDPAVI